MKPALDETPAVAGGSLNRARASSGIPVTTMKRANEGIAIGVYPPTAKHGAEK